MKQEHTTKRYLVFVAYAGEEAGGWYDFRHSFDSYDEAERFIELMNVVTKERWQKWAHVVDTATGKIAGEWTTDERGEWEREEGVA